MSGYVGRFAPSPTGPLHFGSLVAAVASWLDARAANGRWLLRMEDVDTPRVAPGAADAILATLEGLALHWDGEILWQSRRGAAYEEALERLRTLGRTYRCRCSRREIADSAATGIEGAIYPGTCARLAVGAGEPAAERMRVASQWVGFEDRVQGWIAHDVASAIGDFVLKRRDGLHAYQLAVVVDDEAQGVTDVVRGADLLWSTPRQMALQQVLGYASPRYLHFPVATDARGQKLSKQSLAPAIGPGDGVAVLAAALEFLGQAPAPADTPEALLAVAAHQWDALRIPRVAALAAGERARIGE